MSHIHDNNARNEGFNNSLISNNTNNNSNLQVYKETRDVNVYMNNIKQSIKSFTERRKDVEEKINRYLNSPSVTINSENVMEQSKNMYDDKRGSNYILNSGNSNRVYKNSSNKKNRISDDNNEGDRELVYSLNDNSINKSKSIFAEGIRDVQSSE